MTKAYPQKKTPPDGGVRCAVPVLGWNRRRLGARLIGFGGLCRDFRLDLLPLLIRLACPARFFGAPVRLLELVTHGMPPFELHAYPTLLFLHKRSHRRHQD